MPGQITLSSEQAAFTAPMWLEEAACRSVDPELFFDRGQDNITMTKGTISGENARRRLAAKTVCANCPVLLKCREHYMDETHGIYGGLDKDERRALRDGRRAVRRSNINNDLLGQEAFDAFLAGESLSALARANGMRPGQLNALMEHYLRTPAGLRARLEAEITRAYEEGLSEGDTAIKLGLPIPKVVYLRRKLGLVRRTVSQVPDTVSEGQHNSLVQVDGMLLHANYLGESSDEEPFFFMQIEGPKASTRKWVPMGQVRLGNSVRRHVIAKGVGSGIKRKRAGEDQAQGA